MERSGVRRGIRFCWRRRFGAGVAVSVLELACTGQVYAPTILFMLKSGGAAGAALGGGAPPWTTAQYLRNAVFDEKTGQRITGRPEKDREKRYQSTGYRIRSPD
jgi:hypothetical protein